MKTLRIIIPVLLIILMALRADDTVIARLMTSLAKYMDDFTSEQVYMQTDREIYKQGDELWFRGYITDVLQPALSDLSITLYVELCDASGKKLANHKFLIQKGLVSGNFTIPSKTQEGRYILIAYTSWMKNQPPQYVFHKDIIVRKSDFNWINVHLDENHIIARQGKDLTVSGMVTDANGSPITGQSLEYTLTTPRRTIDKGKTTTSGNGQFSLTLSKQVEDAGAGLLLEMKSGKGNSMLYGVSRLFILHSPFTLAVYPEGGNLIEDQSIKTAFVINDASGVSFPFEGNIVNSKGEGITHLKSGLFNYAIGQFKPVAGEKYILNLENPEGVNASFNIGGIKSSAASIHVLGVKDKYIHLMVSSQPISDIKLNLAAIYAGKVFWAANMTMNEDHYITIPTQSLPAGIVDLILLNPEGQVVSERPVFVNQSKCINLGISSKVTLYKPGDKVSIDLDCKDNNFQPIESTVSVSVTKMHVIPGNTDIQAYAIQNAGFSGIEDLSSLRINSGYSINDSAYAFYSCRMNFFNWKTILSQKIAKMPYHFMEGLTGKVFDNANHPVPNADVTMVSGNRLDIYSVKSDSSGRFTLNSRDTIPSGKEFILSATRPDKREKLNISLENSFEKELSNYLDVLGYNIPSNNSEITSTTYVEDNRTPYQRYYSPGKNLIDILKQIKYFNVVNNQIIFPGLHNSIYSLQGALIVVDGVQLGTDASILNSVQASEVADAKISTDPNDIARYTGLNAMGLIDIRTKRGTDPVDFAPVVSKTYQISGYSAEGNYNELSKLNAKAGSPEDTRTTLVWKPDFHIGKDGRGNIQFYTSFDKGSYQVVVQGIAANGSAVYGSFAFQVK